VTEVAKELADAPPQEILRWAVDQYAPGLVMACSFGMQSVVLIDMLHRMDLLDRVTVFYIDTGVLFEQTHQTRIRVQERYQFQAQRVASELSWKQQQEQYGGHLYERGAEGVAQCCAIRKVEPLRRYLSDKPAWITGMRRSHSSTRSAVPVVMWDDANGLVKVNPVALLDDATLWGYIEAHDVPYNPLYDQGYGSIGCDTPICTRPVKPGEDPRAGRWAGLGKSECGIHMDGQIVRSLNSSQL
jgi:phosphoadenosine phosphosulfate reductase